MEDLIKALQILLKYDNPPYPTNCSHYYLYIAIDPSKVSDEDKNKLIELGVVVDSEVDGEGFGSYRYGSC